MSALFTILSGPPQSGKTTYSNKLREDPNEEPFERFEGHNEINTIKSILLALHNGKDVVYETTHTIDQISPLLLARVDTIQIFRLS